MIANNKDFSSLLYAARLELARRNFYEFCKLMAPDFYKDSRPYIKELCEDLQEFFESDDTVLIINMPPRFGKSRTASLLTAWLFGKNINNKIMTGSYNEMLSSTFSRTVRDLIMAEKFDKDIIVYHDIFPHVKVKKGDAAASHWTLEGAYSSYLATSPGGTATGFGSTITILDDLVKNAEEACNEVALEKTWDWIGNTLISRLETGGKICCIMTSWSSNDASRKMLNWCEDENISHKHILMKAKDENGKYLCEDLLDAKTYNMKKSIIGEHIFEANYNQVCLDFEGRLYQSLKTYTKLPELELISAYTDTSDTGQDYFCTVIFGICKNEAYVLDVIYTQKPMTYTEPLLSKKLFENKVNICVIEANNGGSYFAKTVEKTLKEDYRSNYTKIKSFHQSKNKMARILSNSMWVQDHIYFPEGWNKLWPDFYSDTMRYIPNESEHDDNVDVLSGVSEFVNSHNRGQYNDSLYQKGKNVIGLNEYYDRYRTIKNVW